MKCFGLILSVLLVLPLSSYASEHVSVSPQDIEINHVNRIVTHSGVINTYAISYIGSNTFDHLWCGSPDKSTDTFVSDSNRSAFHVKGDGKHRIVCYSTSDVTKHKPENILVEFDIPEGG
jgi:hypothetical protein